MRWRGDGGACAHGEERRQQVARGWRRGEACRSRGACDPGGGAMSSEVRPSSETLVCVQRYRGVTRLQCPFVLSSRYPPGDTVCIVVGLRGAARPSDRSSLVLLSLPPWTSSQPRTQKTLAGALQASARNDHSSAGRPNRRPTSNAASLGGARRKRLPRLSSYARPAWTGARRTRSCSCTPPTVWCDPCLLVPAAAGL